MLSGTIVGNQTTGDLQNQTVLCASWETTNPLQSMPSCADVELQLQSARASLARTGTGQLFM